jgi:uncharacterized membrane protein
MHHHRLWIIIGVVAVVAIALIVTAVLRNQKKARS